MSEFRPMPKPEPKKKKDRIQQWREMQKRSLEKKKLKMKPEQDKLDLWYKRIHDVAEGYCAETGRKLTFDKKHCAHILNKARFPYFKFDLRNGILLSWQIHHILDQGSPAQRKALKVWEYISMVRKQLLEEVGMEYNENFWLNMKT